MRPEVLNTMTGFLTGLLPNQKVGVMKRVLPTLLALLLLLSLILAATGCVSP